MKTTDSVKEKFIKWLAEESGEPEHLVMLMQSVYIDPEKLWKFYSQAEARGREEATKDLITELHNIRGTIHGYISVTEISDLLTKLKERDEN